MALTNKDLGAVRGVVRDETKHLATKADLATTEKTLHQKMSSMEARLVTKIDEESEKIAQLTVREPIRVRQHDESLARHVGYAFEQEKGE